MARRSPQSQSEEKHLVRKTIYVPRAVVKQLDELASYRQVSFSAVASGILWDHLDPDVEALHRMASIKRLERIERRLLHVEHGQAVGVEALNLFISTWLTNTAPVPAGQRATAQSRGQERYQQFYSALVRNLESRSATLLAGVLSESITGPVGGEESSA